MNSVNEKNAVTCFCSMCGKVFKREEAPFMPFCSARCKNIDLGNWVDEKYGIPYEGEESPESVFGEDED